MRISCCWLVLVRRNEIEEDEIGSESAYHDPKDLFFAHLHDFHNFCSLIT